MSNGHIVTGEIFGTAVLILLGCGVCAAVTLKRSKARDAGWLAITFGWGFGVLGGAYIANGYSGGHLNPAVTLGIAIKTGQWSKVPYYLVGQLVGAVIGAFLVWVAYLGQFSAHMSGLEAAEGRDARPAGPVLGVFSTGPEIRNPLQNLLTETVATFVLVLFILTQGMTDGLAENGMGILLTALIVVGIGLSLGGPTGYAINPARDLGPRIVHALLPLPGKGGSDWGYAWIPVAGPLAGAAIAGGLYRLAFT
ncbi:MIP/aquaporin family protein [Streptomyces sp. NPDC021224]|uniref:MIP/aquaporin family protein n=1 Tax=unclassified Streptomyces TaxID=2593676 RepID=UPI0037A9E21D